MDSLSLLTLASPVPEDNGEEETAQLQQSEHLLGESSSWHSERVVEGTRLHQTETLLI